MRSCPGSCCRKVPAVVATTWSRMGLLKEHCQFQLAQAQGAKRARLAKVPSEAAAGNGEPASLFMVSL